MLLLTMSCNATAGAGRATRRRKESAVEEPIVQPNPSGRRGAAR